jgi:hypothetical protein
MNNRNLPAGCSGLSTLVETFLQVEAAKLPVPVPGLL